MREGPESELLTAAEALAAAGRVDEARPLFRRALEASPGLPPAVVGLTRLLLAQGDLGGAVDVARTGLSRDPNDPRLGVMHGDVGLALYRAQLWEDAEPWLARATRAEPWNTVVASAYRRARRPDYLAPEIDDPQLGRRLRRYSAREGDTYIFVIDIVGTCNLRCPTCPVGNSPNRAKGFMSLDLFERIVTKIRRESPVERPRINLYNWGEPLLHPALPQMIARLRELGMTSHLSSNLNIKRGLDAVMAANPDELKISLSGFSPETYSRAHVRGKLDLVVKNMHAVRRSADKHRASTHIWLGHHIYRSNQHEMEPVRRLCTELGFNYNPIPAFYMPLERLMEVVQGQPNERDGGIIEDLLYDPRDRVARAAMGRTGNLDCELRFNQTVINHDGTVALCCTVYDAQNMLGVSYLDEDFAAIEARKYRHPFCRTCIDNNFHYTPQELESARHRAAAPASA